MCAILDGYAPGWEAMTASRRFHHRLEVFMDQALEHLGMTFAQYRVLELVAGSPPIHLSEIARWLLVTRQAVIATVTKLETGALVDRTGESGRVYVSASPEGLRRLEQARRFTEDMKAQLETSLTNAELFRLVHLLDRGTSALRSPELGPEWWLAP
jgi:DNA-binding MarR family transcriptional regulator